MKTQLLATLIITTLLAGCTGTDTEPTPEENQTNTTQTIGCPGHWHAALAIYINNHEYKPGNHQQHKTNQGYHMHAADGILHTHPTQEQCITLQQHLTKLDIAITKNKIILGNTYENPTQANNNQTHQVKIYYQPWQQEWQQVDISEILQQQPANGARILITYTNQDTPQTQLNNVPQIPPQYQP